MKFYSISIALAATIAVFSPAVSASVLATEPSNGTTYYVSPTGKDSNPGTQESPWKNPGAASRKLKPGDTLIILGGRYVLRQYDEDIITPPSGTATAWVTIKGEAGNRPVLAGGDNLLVGIDLSGAHYVRIENLEITHDDTASGDDRFFRDGISSMEKPSGNIVLKDLYIHHIDEFGVNIQDVDQLQILDCRIEYCGFGSIGGPEAGRGGGWKNALVQNCRLSYNGHYYQGGDGSDRPYDRPDGIGLEPSQGPLEISYTVAEHNYGDGLDSKMANTYIHHCVVANNSCDGVKLWGDNSKVENTLIYGAGDGEGGSSPWAGIVIGTETRNARFEITNVTLHDNPSRRAYPMYVQYDDRDVPITVVMRNSIVANGYGLAYFGPSVNLTAEYNLFYRPGDSEQVEANDRTYTTAQLGSLGPGNIYGDPKFVSPAWGEPGDYRLQKGSPAIDAGKTSGAPGDDLEGYPRPQGGGVDIGAYEFSSALALKAPKKLKAVPKRLGKVRLKWRDKSPNEEGFEVERGRGDSCFWLLITTTKAGARAYLETGLSSGTEYRYRVRAFSGDDYSAYSNIAECTARQ
jgi:hypothetical protein